MDKTIKGLMEFILENKAAFPEFGINLFIYLFTALIIVIVIMHIARTIQDPALVKAALFLSTKTKGASQAILNGASKAIESPIKRPKTKFIATVLSVIHCYISAMIFLFLTLGTAFFYSVHNVGLIWYNNIFTLLLIILFSWLTLFFRAQADRDYLSVKEQWKNHNEW